MPSISPLVHEAPTYGSMLADGENYWPSNCKGYRKTANKRRNRWLDIGRVVALMLGNVSEDSILGFVVDRLNSHMTINAT